jgi:hypothetical protein
MLLLELGGSLLAVPGREGKEGRPGLHILVCGERQREWAETNHVRNPCKCKRLLNKSTDFDGKRKLPRIMNDIPVSRQQHLNTSMDLDITGELPR